LSNVLVIAKPRPLGKGRLESGKKGRHQYLKNQYFEAPVTIIVDFWVDIVVGLGEVVFGTELARFAEIKWGIPKKFVF
jgi:hypothetical protein